jgi:hypothetical protein
VTDPRPVPPARPRRRLARSALLGLIVAVAALAGCRDSTTPIREILDDPSRFADQEVRISGEVTMAMGVLGTGAYEVDDGTGKIVVVTQQGGVPREGAKVGVEGRVRTGFTLGTQTLTVLMEERRLSP